MSRLIAVSAPVGGGKTSLVAALARRMPGATQIHFDSFERLSERPLAEMRSWLDRGGDLDELAVPGLPEALGRLRDGMAATDPSTGRTIPPGDTILFETPFARLHRATGSGIDLAIWIDTPLDVALARNLIELGRRFGRDPDFGPWLQDYLASYLGTVRDLLTMQQERVGAAADVVLDGMVDLETNADRATRAIRERLP